LDIGIEKSKYKLLKLSVPKAPYKKEQPSRNIPVIKAPDIKYFNPDSTQNAEFLLKAANI
jgi:hypothetical protein